MTRGGLDAGAFVAFENGDPRVRARLAAARRLGLELATSSPVIGQVWRDGRRQAVSRVGTSVPSTTHDSRRSLGQFWVDSAASRGVIVETIRCAADLEIAKLAASSRIVTLVRNAAHAIKMRCASEHDHGWPRRGSAGGDESRWQAVGG